MLNEVEGEFSKNTLLFVSILSGQRRSQPTKRQEVSNFSLDLGIN